jgi:hypothetical protein
MDTVLITLPDGSSNTIVAEQAFVDEHFPGAQRAPQAEPAPPPQLEPEPAPANAPSQITRLAFRNRFSTAEKVMLKLAAQDDPAAPPQQRQQAAALAVSMDDMMAATFIDLDNADTRAGVQTMEAMGLIGSGRAAEILDAPVTEGEAYQP